MNGYLYAASMHDRYVTSAEYSAGSLKEYHPDAHITLYTEERYLRPSLYSVFDDIVTDGVPRNKRAKLWALSRTPYENTLYLDGDTEIMHKDISTVFDYLGDDDIMLTKIRDYRSAFVYFPAGQLEDHCGVFLYNNSPRTIKFMKAWWDLWQWQENGKWTWADDLYPYVKLKPWDQWTYWWLMNKCSVAIKRGYFPDPDARWNYINGYNPKECPREDIVIYHHTINLKD